MKFVLTAFKQLWLRLSPECTRPFFHLPHYCREHSSTNNSLPQNRAHPLALQQDTLWLKDVAMAIIYVTLVYFYVIMLPSYLPALRFFHSMEEDNNMYDLLNDYLDTFNV